MKYTKYYLRTYLHNYEEVEEQIVRKSAGPNSGSEENVTPLRFRIIPGYQDMGFEKCPSKKWFISY